MQCPVCSEDIDASGGRIQLTRHIRNIHGYALKDADRLSRSAVAPTASDTHAELAALRAIIDNLHMTIESQAEEATQIVAENDALRDEVRRLREAMKRALDVDEPDSAIESLALRQIISRALRGGDARP